MEKIILLSSFMATGAAWGMAWSGGFGILKKDMCSASLLKMVSFIFVVAGSIYGGYLLYELYGQYSEGSAEQKEALRAHYTGKNFIPNGGKLVIQISPIILVLPLLRKSKVICAVVGTCYVLTPLYDLILSKLT